MAKNKKIEIVSITYRSKGKEFVATRILPPKKRKSKTEQSTSRGLETGEKAKTAGPSLLNAPLAVCTPGETKCENGVVWICFDIGGGQTDWLTTNEPC